MYHTAPQNFSSPAGPVFETGLQSVNGLCWAGHARTACTWKLLTYLVHDDVCRRIPAFAEWESNPCPQCWVLLLRYRKTTTLSSR